MKKIIPLSIRWLAIATLSISGCLFYCTDSAVGPSGEEHPFSFSTPSPIKPAEQGGMAEIVITASGGSLPYTFYVVPETQWLAGDKINEMLTRNDFSRLYRYACNRRLFGSHTIVISVSPGSASTPNYYWVSVQDEAENGMLSGTNMLAWWKRVAVYDL